MIKKRICLLVLAVLLVLPVAIALTTEVNVKTLENHKVYVSIQNPDTLGLIGSTSADSGSDGKVTVNVDSGGDDEVNIIVKVTKDGTKIVLEKFTGYANSFPVYFLVTDDQVLADYETEFLAVDEEVVNETVVDEVVEEVVEESEEDANVSAGFVSFFTGLVSSVGQRVFSKTTYYVLGAIVVGLLIFVFIKKAPAMGARASVLAPKPSGGGGLGFFDSRRLASAERRIASAQSEINTIKGRDRTSRAEKRFEREKERFERAKRGE